MKCAVIFSSGMKQIMLTPENDDERFALNLITINDNIKLESKMGTLYDHHPESALGYAISKCQGGYLRAYEDVDSLMLVLTPKKAEEA